MAPPCLWLHSREGDGREERREAGFIPRLGSCSELPPCRTQAEELSKALVSSNWKLGDRFGAERLIKGWAVFPGEVAISPLFNLQMKSVCLSEKDALQLHHSCWALFLG